MLAYLFWHRPRRGVAREVYEQALLEFHRSLVSSGIDTAAFRLGELPFTQRPGYEDWYLIEDWSALGLLGGTAIGGVHGARHDTVARLTGESWGGVYALLRGVPRPPAGVRWVQKRQGERVEVLLERERAQSAWRRQLVLGPAAEICLDAEPAADRVCLWPA
jgi:hypothetical protein